MRRAVIAALLGLAACSGGGPQGAPRPGVVAVYEGGEITFAELEALVPSARTPACVEARLAEGGGSVDQLLPCFEEISEATALEGLILAEIGDVDAAAVELGETYAELRQHAVLQEWTAAQVETIDVSEDEILSSFEAHGDGFRRPRQYTVWNIFRRHEDPLKPEATMAFLRGLKHRYEEGETFAALAREHSHSETRQRDGLVGRMSEDRLPTRLREVAAELSDGEVSDPVSVSGGAVLLVVTEVVEGSHPDVDEVRDQVRRLVVGERIEERLATRTAAVELPEEAVRLGDDELLAALDGTDPERVVVDISGDQVTVDQLRRMLGMSQEDGVADLGDDVRHSLFEVYRKIVLNQLMVVDLLASDEPADREIRARAEAHLRSVSVDHVVEARVREGMQRLLDGRDLDLRRYFDDNRPHYQSELAFKLRIWDLPFDHDPPAQLLAMEELLEELSAAEMTISAAADRLGGAIRDVDWTVFSELHFLPSKARALLLQAPAGGFSVPFQQDDALHLIQVVARREPEALAYGQVEGEVRDDYLDRFSQQLAREFVDGRLADGGYVFFAEELKSQLQR